MPLDPARIQALCFDVDGTLSDTDDLYTQTLERFLPQRFFRDRSHAARRFIMWSEAPGNAMLGFADTLGIDDEMLGFIQWMYRNRKYSAKRFLLVPGVDEMLRYLRGRFPMAVVSARDERGTMAFLDQFCLTEYFDAIITGLSARYTKPYPHPILLAAQKMKVQPEHCLMIGDTTVDIRAGRSAGAQTAGVLCGFGEEYELKRMGADAIFQSTPRVLDVLLG